ncbi:MAG: hypothetical protein ED859_11600 [Desulfuromonadales bacterium]|nr:MAG: hypothetical protein ED859_11600 [Desulfuromonadales bacterium]
MTPHAGKLYFALIVSVLLSSTAAWIIARRYRRRMQQLMRTPHTGESTGPVVEAADRRAPLPVSLADNRSEGIRLSMLLMASSCLIALSSSCIWWALAVPGEPLTARRVAVVALLYLWPVAPGLALVWRWSRKRLLGTMLLWCVVLFVALLWWMNVRQALGVMKEDIALPLVLLTLVFLGSATRAIAPWLLVPAAVLVSSVLAGLDTLTYMAARESPLLKALIAPLEGLPGWSGVYVVFALFVLLSLIIAWWPMRMLGRALGHAYSRKWLSELLVVFAGVWVFALTDRALTLSSSAGAAAFAMYLPLLWIPAVMLLARGRRRTGRVPTLLVLRVFQRDKEVQSLFDYVIERWRLSGNTVMIAGTDLADRILDAADIFQFLDRRLAERFVVSPADVTRRIAAFDMAADIDGRYRINECYCHDTTWQDALQALMRYSDVVLMDLRGFQAHNAGCRYELTTLAQASRELRVVVLTDSRTDRAAVQEAIASGRQERFTWIETSHFKSGKYREVLARLFA